MPEFKVTHKLEIELVEYISAKTFDSARGNAEALTISHMHKFVNAVQKIPYLTKKSISYIPPDVEEVYDE